MGQVLRTSDGGRTWRPQAVESQNLDEILALGPSSAVTLAAGTNRVYATAHRRRRRRPLAADNPRRFAPRARDDRRAVAAGRRWGGGLCCRPRTPLLVGEARSRGPQRPLHDDLAGASRHRLRRPVGAGRRGSRATARRRCASGLAAICAANLTVRMADRYDPHDDRAQVAAGLGRRAHLGGLQRAPTSARSAYVLEMLPYPSGEPHIGHLKNYSVGDAIAHFRRRNGTRVLHPMGYDAFGLPAENHAIKTGEHPRESTEASIAEFQRQFRALGHLDRLDARVRHARAALLPLDPVDLPAAVRARPRLPQGGRGQVVPERPDRARQRAGDRRPLRALRHAGRGAPARAVVLHASPTTPTGCSTTSTTIDWPEHVEDDAAQLDRPLARAPR